MLQPYEWIPPRTSIQIMPQKYRTLCKLSMTSDTAEVFRECNRVSCRVLWQSVLWFTFDLESVWLINLSLGERRKPCWPLSQERAVMSPVSDFCPWCLCQSIRLSWYFRHLAWEHSACRLTCPYLDKPSAQGKDREKEKYKHGVCQILVLFFTCTVLGLRLLSFLISHRKYS